MYRTRVRGIQVKEGVSKLLWVESVSVWGRIHWYNTVENPYSNEGRLQRIASNERIALRREYIHRILYGIFPFVYNLVILSFLA